LDARVALARGSARMTSARFASWLESIEAVERRLGEVEAQVAREKPHEERTALVAEAVDDVIAARLALTGAARHMLPAPVLLLLLVTTAAALMIVGYANGLSGDRAALGTTVLAALTV